MLIARFLKRLSREGPDRRAQIVRVLVRVYLEVPLDAGNRASAETALMAVLDDPAPRVRYAMADALADAPGAPPAVIWALAEDRPDIAHEVLSRSPVLQEHELIDIVASRGARARSSIIARPQIGVGLAAALAEAPDRDAWLALLENRGAAIADQTFNRIADRARGDAGIRSALLERGDLPVLLRQRLVDGLSDALGELVVVRNWMSPERAKRMVADARDRAVLEISSSCSRDTHCPLIVALVADGRITPALLVRALGMGNMRFVEEAFAALAGMPVGRVRSLLEDPGERGLTALYRCSGLPKAVLPAIRSVLAAVREDMPKGRLPQPAQARQRVLDRVARPSQDCDNGEVDELFTLFDRLAADAARQQARGESGGYFRAA